MIKNNKRKQEHKAIPNLSYENLDLECQEDLSILGFERPKKPKNTTSKVDESVLSILTSSPKLKDYTQRLPEKIFRTSLKKWLSKHNLNTQEKREAALKSGQIDKILSEEIDLETFIPKKYRFVSSINDHKQDIHIFASQILEIVNQNPSKGAIRISKELEMQGYKIGHSSVKKYLKKYNLNTKDKREEAFKNAEVNKLFSKIHNEQSPDISSQGFTGNLLDDLGPFSQDLIDYKLPFSLQEENLLKSSDINSAMAKLCDDNLDYDYDILGVYH